MLDLIQDIFEEVLNLPVLVRMVAVFFLSGLAAAIGILLFYFAIFIPFFDVPLDAAYGSAVGCFLGAGIVNMIAVELTYEG